jgi:hypothetical protein
MQGLAALFILGSVLVGGAIWLSQQFDARTKSREQHCAAMGMTVIHLDGDRAWVCRDKDGRLFR